MTKNQYKLFGAFNMYGIIPDAVYPIFENNEKYYFQNSNDGTEINSFVEVKVDCLSLIKPLNLETIYKMPTLKTDVSIGDIPLYVLQFNEEDYLVSNFLNFYESLQEANVDSETLNKAVSKVKEEIDLAKSLIKKKEKKVN